MSENGAVIRFNKVSFNYGHNKPILEEADFSVRRGSKITLMGQNGAGKSTIFKLITGEFKPEEGAINIDSKATIAVSKQVIPRDQMDLTVREFFEKCFKEKVYDIDPKIEKVLDTVNLHAPHDRIIKSFSGGQQARLLLASAIIQNPDILLLDEPTNNLDKEGVEHLTKFIKDYQKTCVVISHDADFLNSFTEGVLYLNLHTLKVELYVGNYFDAVKLITAQIQKENRKNAQLGKKIQDNKDKANFFAMKGGRMRLLAKRMREEAAEMEDNKVDVRQEDKTIRPFTIPIQENIIGEILNISSFSVLKDHKPVTKKAEVSLRKNRHLLLSGPNGIGKSTLLEAIADSKAEGSTIANGIKVGYYRQDFSTLNFEDTAYEALSSVMEKHIEGDLRSVAASFLITKDIIHTKIGNLSEGQKGLVAFAQLVLLKPSLLILDEPTNHINFRHLPVIAKALDEYQGAMILVSHVPDFVEQIRIDETLDLGK
ncbi:ATP-binding cassette domain-containing protein [Patescibacteria group bacterium]|nr:ATP-binding cassette domain-containing protein [Patescibacteria group bacterium]